jgi:superfamily II RNA helicase
MILSEFQQLAVNSIEQGHHVLVTAHTGSGKTLPAEHAIRYFTGQGKRVIYTAPIKALSNQKYNEFTKKFPELQVGIFTGDNKQNPDASILIMTTEILQNKLMQPEASHLDFELNDLGCVVFDEVHYIDDEERGTVWENTIIRLPKTVQMVMLSATIGDKEGFAGWVEKITQRKVVICSTEKRIVPLIYTSFFTAPTKKIDNLKDPKQRKEVNALVDTFDLLKQDKLYELNMEKNKRIHKLVGDVSRKFVLNQLCEKLREREQFPCLFFVFSRKKLEEMAKEIQVPLFDPGEIDFQIEPICKQLLVTRLENWKEYMLLPEYTFYISLLKKGIGIHHAGMLPIFREMIEILYEQKYIAVLFATETFSIGLNMPTKTVCFTSLYKHDGHNLRLLYPHEFTQMSGRAGRRGIDTVGHVVLVSNLYEPPDTTTLVKLFVTPPKVIKSKFKMNYALLLKEPSLDAAKQIAHQSLMKVDIERTERTCRQALEEQLIQYHDKRASLHQKDECLLYQNKWNKMEMLPAKQKKEAMKQCREMETSTFLSQYALFRELQVMETEIERLQGEETYASTYVETKMNELEMILKNNGFVEDKKTRASCIHEVHPLVMTELCMETNYFKEYTSTELFGLLSCLCDVKVEEPLKTYHPTFRVKEHQYLQTRLQYYLDQEYKYDLPSTEVQLQYDMAKYVCGWMEKCTNEMESVQWIETFKHEKGLFVADFIKVCLKLVNIARELERAYEDKPELCVLLKSGTSQLLKFVCTQDSLYL